MSQKTYKYGAVCAVNGCRNYKIQKDSKSFFRMPRDLERLKKWIVACNRSDLDSLLKVKETEYFNKNYVVCSDHFEEVCFRNKDLYSQGLLRNSIPTLNLYNADIKPFKRHSLWEVNVEECAISSEKIKLQTKDCEELPTISSLQEENTKLRQIIQDYKNKLINKSTISSKYKKRCSLSKRKLVKSDIINSISDCHGSVTLYSSELPIHIRVISDGKRKCLPLRTHIGSNSENLKTEADPLGGNQC